MEVPNKGQTADGETKERYVLRYCGRFYDRVRNFDAERQLLNVLLHFQIVLLVSYLESSAHRLHIRCITPARTRPVYNTIHMKSKSPET